MFLGVSKRGRGFTAVGVVGRCVQRPRAAWVVLKHSQPTG